VALLQVRPNDSQARITSSILGNRKSATAF
jgi:hypothetical protein